jgi:hypothetical protein
MPFAVLVTLLAACGGSPSTRAAEAPVSTDDAVTALDRVAAQRPMRPPVCKVATTLALASGERRKAASMSSEQRNLGDSVESDLVDIGRLSLREIVADGASPLDHSVRRILAEMRDPGQEPTAGHSNATSGEMT